MVDQASIAPCPKSSYKAFDNGVYTVIDTVTRTGLHMNFAKAHSVPFHYETKARWRSERNVD